ncbi:BlaI/MecI/CopY family transcriptional regulator [soil metagenome]
MRISASESQIMEVLWKQDAPIPSEDILEAVAQPNGWSEGTVRTLLNRLLNKNAVEATREGRRYLYRPLVSREAYVRSESKGFLDRLFDGRLSPLVTHFSETNELSATDIAELKQLIARVEDGR